MAEFFRPSMGLVLHVPTQWSSPPSAGVEQNVKMSSVAIEIGRCAHRHHDRDHVHQVGADTDERVAVRSCEEGRLQQQARHDDGEPGQDTAHVERSYLLRGPNTTKT